MKGVRSRRVAVLIACTAAAAAAAGCSPGSSSSSKAPSAPAAGKIVTDASKLGKVTIIEWDKQVGEASQNAAQNQINAAFQKLYPNITVKRVSKSFNDLKTTLKLSLSNGSPPDVVQVNQGPGDLGAIVKGNLLLPLNNYAQRYGWLNKFKRSVLAQNESTPTGAWGRGNLYGISNTAELVGVCYHKQLLAKAGLPVPATYPEFIADLPKIKAAGLLPISYGASDKSPAIHLLGPVVANLAGEAYVNNLVLGTGTSSWTSPAAVQALQVLADWGKKGYISPDANGQTGDQAAAAFGAGKGVFLISGTWNVGNLMAKMKSNVGFTELKPTPTGIPSTIGGLGLLFAVTAKSKHADAAAAYVNFLASPQVADIVAKSGDLPSVSGGAFSPPAGSLEADVYQQLHAVLNTGGPAPYLDYSTPNFYDVVTAQVQELTSGRSSAASVAKALANEDKSYRSSQ